MHLNRVMTVLENVAIAGRAVSASEIQQATGLPRPTCYRLLQTMAEHRLLDVHDTGRYLVGDRLVRLALTGRSDVDVSQAAAPTLKEAADQFGEAVFLSRYRNNGVEIIHVETPRDGSRSFVHPGLGYRPMHACSCSKVIAAFADDAFRETVLTGPLRSYTDHTKNDPDELRQEFSTILQSGFAECVEEIEVGVSSVAAPIRIGNMGVPFSVGTTGPIRRFTNTRREELGQALCVLAGKISTALQIHGTGKPL